MFQMQKYYGEKKKLFTNDTLTAVKIASNYEADLYKNGRLIMSPLGLEREDNTKLLESVGIKTFLKDNRYGYEYLDDSKNIKKIFIGAYKYSYDGEPKVSSTAHDYQADPSEIEFDTIDEVKDYLEKTYPDSEISLTHYEHSHLNSYNYSNGKWITRY